MPVAVCLKVISQHLSGETEENYAVSFRINGDPSEIEPAE